MSGFNVSDAMKKVKSCQASGIRHLGVKIGKTNKDMIRDNVVPLADYLRENKYPFSWFGRIAAVRMKLLPKRIIFFQNVILDVPRALLNKIQGIINNFIWAGKRARIRLQTLQQKIENGGLAIPNVQNYYHAAMLVACLDGWRFHLDNDILALEQAGMELPLVDWLVTTKGIGSQLRRASHTVCKLEKVWLKYREGSYRPTCC